MPTTRTASATNLQSAQASPIAFGPQQPVNAAGMSIADKTSPCVVNFLESTYLFFAGGGNNGIWMTNSSDGALWTNVFHIVPPNAQYLGIAEYTSPAAVAVTVPASRLFLFFTGNGDNGIFFSTTADGSAWSDVAQIVPPSQQWVPILASTSPCAIVVDDLIHLYFSGNQQDGVYTIIATKTSPGSGPDSWSAMTSVISSRVAPGGTPSAVFFDGTFYVFYVVPSSGANSIWYVTSDDGIHWGQPQQVPLPMAVADGASPTAFVSGSTLYLFWFSKNGLQATATSDGQSWAGVTSFSGGQVFSLPANASAAVVGNQLAVFWPGNLIAYHSTVAG